MAKLTEVARSFSYKLNIPGKFESRDFFCSRKEECEVQEAEAVSRRLFAFCKREVLLAVREYQEQRKVHLAKAAQADDS